MTTEQNKLFNLLAKPTIFLDEDKKNFKKISTSNFKMMANLESARELFDLRELKNYVNRVTSEGKNASEIDLRLISFLDENNV